MNRLFRAVRRPALVAVLVFAALASFQVLHAQRATSGYSGGGPVWWTAGLDEILPRQDDYDDATGRIRMILPAGMVPAKGHPFFEALGSNGRACITCHQPSSGMSVSVAALKERWEETQGKDAVFAAVDGSNCPDLPQSAIRSHSLLLDRGLFRIALPWPPRAADGQALEPEFRIDVVSDPTGCNTSAAWGLRGAHPAVSVFRRPRVAANIRYVTPGPDGFILMADGRESTLRSQAINAAAAHELAAAPDEKQLQQIVDFEMSIYTAQGIDALGGLLNELTGPLALGPENLADQKAPRLDATPSNRPSFDIWRKPVDAAGDLGLQLEFRASVARGSDLFFGRQFQIPALGAAGTCASCHSPQAPRWLDIGTANTASTKPSELPLFRITCDTPSTPAQYKGQVTYTHDPGRALISGKCADTGAFVIQQFHALAARAPYFTNGSAASLDQLVDYYQRRFALGLTAKEKQDLVNYLRVL